MKSSKKVQFIISILIIKIIQLQLEEDITINLNDLLLFLDRYEFSQSNLNKKSLINFANGDKTKEIIEFLWINSIINPEI